MPTSQLLLKVIGIKAYVRRLRHLEQGRIFYRAAPAVNMGKSFYGFIQRVRSICHLATSYDNQGVRRTFHWIRML